MNSAAKAIQTEITKREREIAALKMALSALSSNGAAPAAALSGRRPAVRQQQQCGLCSSRPSAPRVHALRRGAAAVLPGVEEP
jgi:hypothetical protein